ncbi:hypothetical protein [Mucilaginibacter rubeus]|uniref:Uncharacterized protein n=1 Tax=Mucilaginibacter rubeus TaxID=2027860 RepID=A0A5C1I2B0_9SPHI|nr:hypothetical protein [Mucilaginibacter rubeus]QEM12372.1 hypothetical protein DEO27_020910 [Mucilaginibacter rubeus]
MKRYTSEELAHHAKQFAQDKYDSAESIYQRFKSDLNRRMKRSQPTMPLKDELERQAKILAGKAYEKFYHISEEGIERKLSGRLTNDAFHPGIELDDYQDYFDEFADEMVKASISAAFAPLAEAIKAIKKKRRK